jgi:ABC-type branched-subunit amino acid transport system permease subunit
VVNRKSSWRRLLDPQQRGKVLREWSRDPNAIAYGALLIGGLAFPGVSTFLTGTPTLTGVAADAGVWVLLAIGLNVVVGFAGLLDLGYAAFFAIGAYSYALLASPQLGNTPLHHAVHLPFWLVLFIAMFIAAASGAILGFPTLRLRGDYLAIVTLGFGEIVPRIFRNADVWTGGINAIGGIDQPWLPICLKGPWSSDPLQISYGKVDCSFSTFEPTAYYVLMLILIIACVFGVTNLQRSRLGRAWMAVREDETAAASCGVNTVSIKLLGFAIGAAFSGFAGAYYGAKLSLVSPDNFQFIVSITVLVMVVLGGMGNIPGVIIGSLVVYYIQFKFLIDLPANARDLANSIGLHSLNQATPGGWPGLETFVGRLNFIVTGLILVVMMLLRPQGLLPSPTRRLELTHDAAEPIAAPRELQS